MANRWTIWERLKTYLFGPSGKNGDLVVGDEFRKAWRNFVIAGFACIVLGVARLEGQSDAPGLKVLHTADAQMPLPFFGGDVTVDRWLLITFALLLLVHNGIRFHHQHGKVINRNSERGADVGDGASAEQIRALLNQLHEDLRASLEAARGQAVGVAASIEELPAITQFAARDVGALAAELTALDRRLREALDYQDRADDSERHHFVSAVRAVRGGIASAAENLASSVETEQVSTALRWVESATSSLEATVNGLQAKVGHHVRSLEQISTNVDRRDRAIFGILDVCVPWVVAFVGAALIIAPIMLTIWSAARGAG